MSVTDVHQKTEAELVREAFSGVKGREPESDSELKEWIASPEGKAATAYWSAEVYRWGDSERS